MGSVSIANGPKADWAIDSEAMRAMRAEKRAQKSHPMTCHYADLGSASSTNQKRYSDLRGDTSSVWNFCARFSDVIWRGNQWWGREMSAVSLLFSQVLLVILTKVVRVY